MSFILPELNITFAFPFHKSNDKSNFALLEEEIYDCFLRKPFQNPKIPFF